jgi:hypothetical protein
MMVAATMEASRGGAVYSRLFFIYGHLDVTFPG